MENKKVVTKTTVERVERKTVETKTGDCFHCALADKILFILAESLDSVENRIEECMKTCKNTNSKRGSSK